MSDRCISGTGKVLEIIATLGFDIEKFGRQALLAEENTKIK